MYSPILVTGASGQLGRQIIRYLVELGAGAPIIAVTRTPDKLSGFVGQAVQVRAADFRYPETLLSAFAGAKRLLLISTNTYGPAGQRATEHGHAIEAAKQVGVEHIIYTSFITKGDDLAFLTIDHAATEDQIQRSGLAHTILRNSFYTELALRTLASASKDGRFYTAAGEGRIAYVTREDCARAAATALASPDGGGNRVIEITGPAAISAMELATITTQVRGTRFQPVFVSPGELQERLMAQGSPAAMAAVLAAIDRAVSMGAMDVQSGGFESLTGRRPVALVNCSQFRSVFQMG